MNSLCVVLEKVNVQIIMMALFLILIVYLHNFEEKMEWLSMRWLKWLAPHFSGICIFLLAAKILITSAMYKPQT